jgi:hypothetical protein
MWRCGNAFVEFPRKLSGEKKSGCRIAANSITCEFTGA